MPEEKIIEVDEELARLKQERLREMLGYKAELKPKESPARILTHSHQMALRALEKELPIEVVTRTVDFGPVDPMHKQVQRFHPKRKGIIVTLRLDPDEKQWIEHILKTLENVPLKRSEVQLVMKHINRLNYEGALRDHYEFYGLSLRELEEKAVEERSAGHSANAERLEQIVKRYKKK